MSSLTSDLQHQPWYVGPWRVEPTLHRLSKGDHTIQLEPKVMQVLICLGTSAGNVTTRDDLLATVWAGTNVHPKVLSRAISELRKAFGDNRTNPRFIETIPKQGYRLIAPVSPSLSRPPSARSFAERKTTSLTWIIGILALGLISLAAWWLQAFGQQRTLQAPIPLTTYPGPEQYPALSPNGSRLAFVQQAPDERGAHLYLKHVGEESVVQLTKGPFYDLAPTWSPDGLNLAFFRHTDTTKTLYTISALGGTPRRLMKSATRIATHLAWAPQGDWLVYPDTPDTTHRLHLMAFSLTTHRANVLITPPPGYLGDRTPAFSTDGVDLAFVRTHAEGVDDILVGSTRYENDRMRLISLEQHTTDATSISGLTWLPDNRLAFASSRGGITQLWISSRNQPLMLVPTGSRPVLSPSSARTGSQLAFVEQSTPINLWRIDLHASPLKAEPLASSTHYDSQPLLAPDGATLAFVSNRTGTFELWKAGPDGAAPEQLTQLGGPYISYPSWSPDSRSLAFAVHAAAGTTLYALDIATQHLTPIDAPEDAQNTHPVWSPQGDTLILASNRLGPWDLWKTTPGGTASQRITYGGGYASQPASDGTYVYYTKHGVDGLWRKDLRADSESLVLPGFPWYDWGAWALAETGVYLIDRTASGTLHLAFFDLASQEIHRLTALPGYAPSNQRILSRSSDGRVLYLALAEHLEADIMLLSL